MKSKINILTMCGVSFILGLVMTAAILTTHKVGFKKEKQESVVKFYDYSDFVTAEDICSLSEINSFAAKKKYHNKELLVVGMIDDILGNTSNPRVRLYCQDTFLGEFTIKRGKDILEKAKETDLTWLHCVPTEFNESFQDCEFLKFMTLKEYMKRKGKEN